MSLFFDVWCDDGFVLGSDVRLSGGESKFLHKLCVSGRSSRVKCAVAVCGDYPEVAINSFVDACARKDSLREIAHLYASKWTERFSGTNDYSAVHLVGFESDSESNQPVPQVWFWCNGKTDGSFHSNEDLQAQLSSFSKFIPINNHIPQKLEEAHRDSLKNLKDERQAVTTYLSRFGPIFTWNGDMKFWGSAVSSIGAILELAKHEKRAWIANDLANLVSQCLVFLANVGNILMPSSSVGLSPDQQCDVVILRSGSIERVKWADFN